MEIQSWDTNSTPSATRLNTIYKAGHAEVRVNYRPVQVVLSVDKHFSKFSVCSWLRHHRSVLIKN